jgi:hypothetical protein
MIRASTVIAAVLTVFTTTPVSAHEIVVGDQDLKPRVLTVKTGERVDFRNSAGRPVPAAV